MLSLLVAIGTSSLENTAHTCVCRASAESSRATDRTICSCTGSLSGLLQEVQHRRSVPDCKTLDEKHPISHMSRALSCISDVCHKDPRSETACRGRLPAELYDLFFLSYSSVYVSSCSMRSSRCCCRGRRRRRRLYRSLVAVSISVKGYFC